MSKKKVFKTDVKEEGLITEVKEEGSLVQKTNW